MCEHFISDDLYHSLIMLPDSILTASAVLMRRQWHDDPENGDALLGYLIMAEAAAERGLILPPTDDPAKERRALSNFFIKMADRPDLFCN